jgi:hypothetical protein
MLNMSLKKKHMKRRTLGRTTRMKGEYLTTFLFLETGIFVSDHKQGSWKFICSYPKGLIVAFKLKKVTDDSAVNESETKLETSDSTEKPSCQGPEEGTPETSGTKEEKCSADMTEEKEVGASEATESGEKCPGESLAESEKCHNNESLSGNGKNISGNAKSPISREDLKEAFKKYGTVRVMAFVTTFHT